MAKEDTSKKSSYSAESITVLEGLDPVRKRPGMYIGTTGPDGLHHLIWEVFDNSRDEAMGGFANDIEVVLLPNNRIRVADNGRGIPVDIHKQTKVSALETIMTTLHAGGKFGGEGYKVAGGLHGVGVSVVNALSIFARVDVHRDGGHFMQEYSQGKKKALVKKVEASSMRGTIVTFEADKEIFNEIKYDWNKIVAHMRQQAYLVKGLRISVIDARGYEGKFDPYSVFWLRDLKLEVPSLTFYFEGGLLSLVKFYNQYQKPIHKNIFYIDRLLDDVQVEIALQYVDDITARMVAYANNIYNPEGGTHITGFKTALTRTLNSYARKNNLIKEDKESFSGDDVLEGLTAVVSIKIPSERIQFEGQTKAKLGSVEARGAVETVFGEAFSSFLEENPDDARAMISKAVLAFKARMAAKAAKDSVLRKGALEGMTLPGKLADCQTKNAEESELFIVEGDSAGGCFVGETEVALADGRTLSFKDLVKEQAQGKQNYCYTINTEGSIEIAPILHARVTKKNAQVLKIILDTGDEIICTPDHKFMLRDGSYKEAKDLTTTDSLMPLVKKISEIGGRITISGYEMVLNPANHHWMFTHMLADEYNQKQGVYEKFDGEHIHHKDFNKRNNSPENLVRLSKEAHLQYHRDHIAKTLHTTEAKNKARLSHQKSEYKEKIRQIMSTPSMRALLSDRAKKQWQNEDYKAFMTEKFLKFYNSNEEYRKKNNALLSKVQKEYWSSAENRAKQSKRVTAFFSMHPEKKEELRYLAHTQWQQTALKDWRSETTKKQWTDEFRAKRKKAYNQTYLTKALYTLHTIYDQTGSIDFTKYNEVRRQTKDRSLIRYQTIADRFFSGNTEKLKEAAEHYNHRIRDIVPVESKIDVYDIEVPQTHNFALASGIFVHNSAKMGRDRRTQAILPLRGKILNVERARLDKMLASNEVKALVVALGTAIGDLFDVSKLRYHKVIIATDADVDGAHIRTLLLTLFFRHFRPLIEGGYIYIAQPPLYKISKGKDIRYAYSDEEKFATLKDMGIDASVAEQIAEESQEGGAVSVGESEAGATEVEAAEGEDTKKTPKVSIQRYKGLGEMNPEELWETTMNPQNRVLKQVNIEDAQEADIIFDTLMGTDVTSRKSFIQSNARLATLDI